MLGYLRARAYPQLIKAAGDLVARSYATADLHFAAHQLAALIRKYPWDPKLIGTDPEAAARKVFLAAERRCGKMNRRLQLLYRKAQNNELNERGRELWMLLSKMREWIRYVIGDEVPLSMIWDECDFTGGAAIGCAGDATNLGRKLTAPSWTCTPSALELFCMSLVHNHHFATRVAKREGVYQSLGVDLNDLRRALRIVTHEEIAFVLKTVDVHRTIAKQPIANGFLQKGTDVVFRLFLKRVGLDLSDQRQNQEMARKGSLPGCEDDFCTIDLKSASDSIFLELCRKTLPPDWFYFLNRIRCPSYKLDGKEFRLEKMCAMGNGFCFPLETLLFASICEAAKAGVAGVDYRVYGDDIIVRKKYFPVVMKYLKRLGFLPNKKKTFGEGPFRESCGGNWYSGEDVTPFTLDFRLDSLESYFKFANLGRRNTRSSRFLSDAICLVIQQIPIEAQLWRPFKGSPSSGLDPLDVQFTRRYFEAPSPNFGWNKEHQCPTWWELVTQPVEDEQRYPQWVVKIAVLKGMSKTPDSYKVLQSGIVTFTQKDTPLFTYRRKVVTRVRRVGRSGDLGPSDFKPDSIRARSPQFSFRLIRQRK